MFGSSPSHSLLIPWSHLLANVLLLHLQTCLPRLQKKIEKGRNIPPDNWVVSSWRKRIQQDRKKHRTAEEFPHVQVIMHATSSLPGPPQLPLLLLCPLSRHLLENLVAQWQDHCQPVHTHPPQLGLLLDQIQRFLELIQIFPFTMRHFCVCFNIINASIHHPDHLPYNSS